MLPACVNSGGPDSLLRLPRVPRLEQPLELPPEADAALRAWQARPGLILTAVDPHQTCYRVRLQSPAGSRPAVVVPFARLDRPVESRLRLEVFHALPDKERFELVLQKLTELGASRIVPMTTARSLTLGERDAPQKKSHRWPDIVRNAALQCRRAMLPELTAVASWDAACLMASRAELGLMLYEGDTGWSLGEAVAGPRPGRLALLIGPEGGFSGPEVEDARRLGMLPVSLGPRLLRTETAAIAAAAALQFHLGDLR